MCSPKHQPKAWEEWRERLNGWSGGQDVYTDISAIAQEVPGGPKALAIDVAPRRWWCSA